MMHFTLVWDSNAPDKRHTEIERQIENCFSQLASVNPIFNFYLIQVTSAKEYDKIYNKLKKIAENFENDEVHFIMSPLIKGGTYDGLIPEDLWVAINNITK